MPQDTTLIKNKQSMRTERREGNRRRRRAVVGATTPSLCEKLSKYIKFS